MKSRKPSGRHRLALQRETLRVLLADELAHAAGRDSIDFGGHPKTTAWTGDQMQPCH